MQFLGPTASAVWRGAFTQVLAVGQSGVGAMAFIKSAAMLNVVRLGVRSSIPIGNILLFLWISRQFKRRQYESFSGKILGS